MNFSDTSQIEPRPQLSARSTSVTKSVAGAAKSKTAVKAERSPKRPKSRPATAKRSKDRKTGSKQDRVLALLRRREGATLDALIKATGWKKHSVRGFLAGTVRKKLKLPLISEKLDGVRTYRIGGGKNPKKAKTSGARSA